MARADDPPGFTRASVDGATLVASEAVADRLAAAGMADPETLRARAHAVYVGRGNPFAVRVAGVGRVFVRPYLHGGVLGRLTGARHAGDGRFADELAVLVAARRAGAPVCEPLGYVSRGGALGLRHGWLLVCEEEGAEDVLSFLLAEPTAAERRAVLAAAGRSIRALHDAGFAHPDLHLKNVLRTLDGRVLVLDLDRATGPAEVSRARRVADLFRFDRYAAKRAERGDRVSRTDRLRVLRAYAGGDWPDRAELRDLAARLSNHIARHRAVRRDAAPEIAGR